MLVVIKSIIGDTMAKQNKYSTIKIFRTLDEQIAILENTIADLEARINALENK